MRQKLDTSERRTCRTVGMARSTQQYKARKADDDEALHLLALTRAKNNLDTSKNGVLGEYRGEFYSRLSGQAS